MAQVWHVLTGDHTISCLSGVPQGNTKNRSRWNLAWQWRADHESTLACQIWLWSVKGLSTGPRKFNIWWNCGFLPHRSDNMYRSTWNVTIWQDRIYHWFILACPRPWSINGLLQSKIQTLVEFVISRWFFVHLGAYIPKVNFRTPNMVSICEGVGMEGCVAQW